MMTQIKDRIINWSFSDLVEVELTNSKESFNIVAETLRRIGIANKEKKSYTRHAIYFIKMESIILYISKNYLVFLENLY